MMDPMSNVFLVPFHVTPTENSIMPEGSAGAYVRCYVSAGTVETAIQKSITQLKSDGLFAEKVLEPIQQMDSSEWAVHVNDQWPDHAASLMSQGEFDAAMDAENVVYGPFGTYNPSEA